MLSAFIAVQASTENANLPDNLLTETRVADIF